MYRMVYQVATGLALSFCRRRVGAKRLIAITRTQSLRAWRPGIGCVRITIRGAMFLWACSFLTLPPTTVFAQSGPLPVVAQPGSKIADALRSTIEGSEHPHLDSSRLSGYREPLARIYEDVGYGFLWTREGEVTTQARQVIEVFLDAASKGLRVADYEVDLLQSLRDGAGSQTSGLDLAGFDTAMSLTLMRYISDIHCGRVDPKQMGFDLSIEPKRLDLAAQVFVISRAEYVAEALVELEPKLLIYHRLKDVLAVYRSKAEDPDLVEMPSDRTIRPGDIYAEIAALRHLLTLVGDLPDDDQPVSDEHYQGALIEAVKGFQTRHGLAVDGVIGPATFAQLNVPMAKRVAQIEMALERLRWLPVPADGPTIVANIPAFELYAFNVKGAHEHLSLKMDVIVGSTVKKHETPVFSADMGYLVFRPYWNIPRSITVKEIVPKAQRNPSYLSRRGYEIVDRFADRAKVYSASPANIARLRSGRLKVRQRPGANNALGLVKFMLPNANSIYLHSTPSKQLFHRSRRDFSHGCIRVQDPVALAEFVLAGQDQDWDPGRIKRAMNGKRSQTVRLKAPIPVYIFYTTAIVREDAQVAFFEDIYGHDTRLQELLEGGYPYRA